MSDAVWLALAWVLILEGLLPFLFPSGWRNAMLRLAGLRDGQIRFVGLLALATGLLLILA